MSEVWVAAHRGGRWPDLGLTRPGDWSTRPAAPAQPLPDRVFLRALNGARARPLRTVVVGPLRGMLRRTTNWHADACHEA